MYHAGHARAMMGAQPMGPQTPPPPGMSVQPMMTAPPARRSQLLVWGSMLRIMGAVLGGLALLWLGLLIMNPTAMVDPANPLAFFQTIGAIIVLAAVSSILVGVGWAMQTWGVGVILSFDQG